MVGLLPSLSFGLSPSRPSSPDPADSSTSSARAIADVVGSSDAAGMTGAVQGGFDYVIQQVNFLLFSNTKRFPVAVLVVLLPTPMTQRSLVLSKDVLVHLSKSAARSDGNLLRRPPALGAHFFNGGDDVHAVDDLAKDDVPAIEPRRGHGRHEELRAVRVRPGIGHGEQAGLVVLEGKVLVRELPAVYRPAACTVVPREVAALDHELTG